MASRTRDRPFQGTDKIKIDDFTQRYDIHPWLLSWPHRSYDPWEQLKILNDHIEGLHDYSATIMQQQVREHSGQRNRQMVLYLRGCYPISDTGPIQWTNPEYAHGANTMHCGDTRLEHIQTVAETGLWELQDIAKRYDVTRSALRKQLGRNDMVYQQLRKIGGRRLARSIMTTVKWTKHSQRELIRRLPDRYTAINDRIQRHCRDSDWEAPPIPEKENTRLIEEACNV